MVWKRWTFSRKLFNKSVRRRNQNYKEIQKILLFVDKTSNIYQIEKDSYKKLTTDAMTSTYKKIIDEISNKVDADGKKIIENK